MKPTLDRAEAKPMTFMTKAATSAKKATNRNSR